MQRSIWFVLDLTSTRSGAISEQLVAVANRLRAEDAWVTMVFSTPPASGPLEALESLGVDVRILDFRSPRAALALFLWFREYRPDIVHFHFVEPRASFVAAAKLCGATTLVQDHSLGSLRAPARRARELALNWLVDTRFEVHDAVPLARFEGRDGASVRRELGIGALPLVVAAALDEMKGGDTLLRAVALLEPDVHLAIAGHERPSEVTLRALASTLGIDGRVHFLGPRDDLEEVFAAATVVVVAPESEEGFDVAALEGMAASRPVIVTRSGALPTILGDAGIVVPQRDPASLGLAIRTVLSDPEHGSRLGRLGRKRVEEHYSSDAYVELLMKMYRRIFLRSEPRTAPLEMLQLA